MFRILTSSADTYITNKIVGNSRVTDANVGRAGTIDLFKLYDETFLSGTTAPIELSRALIKFDLDPLRALTGTILNTAAAGFKCYLKLTDVYGGQTTPTNFNLVVYPLSRSFDEGSGRDIISYQDLDTSNFVTASGLNTNDIWATAGADAGGYLGGASLDFITSGTIEGATVDFGASQAFTSGEENLYVDVTTVVSATLASLMPDKGFRISFSGSEETDSRTRFVKRFYSRHATNVAGRPQLIALWDDSIQDDHKNFFFDVSGSLFLHNHHQGVPANIVSGASLTQITSSNSLLVKLFSGSYSTFITASQHTVGNNLVSGVYSATFAIPSSDTSLLTEIYAAGSGTFTEVWQSLDNSVPFFSGTLVINAVTRTAFDNEQRKLVVHVTNSRHIYHQNERVKFRIYAFDFDENNHYRAVRQPTENVSNIFRNMHYRIKDAHTGNIIIPFDSAYNSTKMSTDSRGMTFEIFMDSLSVGRVYEIDVMLIDRGINQVFNNVGGRFRVEP